MFSGQATRRIVRCAGSGTGRASCAGRGRDYGDGSTVELKLYGEQSGGDWAVVENVVRAGDEPPIHTHTR